MNGCLPPAIPHWDRRSFLRLGALALGAAALPVWGAGRPIFAAGNTEALLLSCMDFRLMDDITAYMERRKLTNKYDHVILAGASLGAQTSQYPAWAETFWQHLDVAIQLHHIHKVILLDHRDCGAYKVILGKDFSKDPAEETRVHAEQLKKLETAIRAKHGDLGVDTLLMSLDGKVQQIG